jgi:hypothetical protein
MRYLNIKILDLASLKMGGSAMKEGHKSDRDNREE